VESPESSDSDEELFRRALEGLRAVPDKDSPARERAPRRAQRVRAPKTVARPPDEVLDLHRRTVREARTALNHFIQRTHHEGNRSVLVVTGKGHGSATPGGVLRAELERWLRHEGSAYVRTYSEAPRALGGRGAFLLNLR